MLGHGAIGVSGVRGWGHGKFVITVVRGAQGNIRQIVLHDEGTGDVGGI